MSQTYIVVHMAESRPIIWTSVKGTTYIYVVQPWGYNCYYEAGNSCEKVC